MPRTGGKGRISNELVAASCAAVLTVYAAGYWRTREVARQLETQAQERRRPRPASEVVPAPAPQEPEPAAVEPPVVQAPAVPEVAAPAVIEEPLPPPKAPSSPPEKQPVKVAAASASAAEPENPAAVHSVPLEEPPPALDTAPAPGALPAGFEGWPDGTYTGWGTSYHGDIEAKIVIEGGRIVDSGIVTCATRYPCDVIYTILFQPVQRQSPEVDRVSRATESADAYYYALVQALEKADKAAAPASPSPSP